MQREAESLRQCAGRNEEQKECTNERRCTQHQDKVKLAYRLVTGVALTAVDVKAAVAANVLIAFVKSVLFTIALTSFSSSLTRCLSRRLACFILT